MDSGPGGAGSAVNGPKGQGRAAALVRGQAEAEVGCRPRRGPRAACPGPRPVSGSHCPGELGRLGQVGHGWGPAAPPAGSRTPTRAARPTRQVKCCPRQAGPALGAAGARTGSRTRSWTAPRLPDEPDPGHSPHMHLGPGARGGAGAEGPPPSTQAGPLTRSRNHCSAVRDTTCRFGKKRERGQGTGATRPRGRRRPNHGPGSCATPPHARNGRDPRQEPGQGRAHGRAPAAGDGRGQRAAATPLSPRGRDRRPEGNPRTRGPATLGGLWQDTPPALLRPPPGAAGRCPVPGTVGSGAGHGSRDATPAPSSTTHRTLSDRARGPLGRALLDGQAPG